MTMKTRGRGLLMVWTDVDAEHEEGFNRWYNEDHVPRLLKIPGFLSAGRYRALKGGPRYLAMYELEDHNVLRSAGYLDQVRYHATAEDRKNSGGNIGRNYISNGYRQIFPVWINPIEMTMPMSPYLQMGRIDIPAHIEEEFNAWYNTVYIPGNVAVPGCTRARRYVAVEGQPKYLTVYEFENPQVPETPAWLKARDANPWTARVRPQLLHDTGSPGVYERIFPPR